MRAVPTPHDDARWPVVVRLGVTSSDPAFDALYFAFQSALAGRYSIDREIGRGGMGIVYLAREVHLDRLVAIKLLPPELARDPALRERFLREARLAARLSHPNIIPIHAVEDIDEFVFYVMAYIDGETLAQRVRTRGPLSASDGVRVLREVAWALAHAHSHGVVHRDVKPDNILLEHGGGRALVADFGIAAATGDVVADRPAGTPEFMSPEHALGKAVDGRSDVYSLGATGFFAFSGRFPFEGASATEVLAKHVTEPAPALTSFGLSVPRKVAVLIKRCLAKDPDERPATADTLAEQLGVALEQRREMPAALRAFVKRNGRLDSSGTLMYPFPLVFGSVVVMSLWGFVPGLLTFAFGATAPPFAALVYNARKLARLGFAHPDVDAAFAAEIDQALEERAVENVRLFRRTERVIGFMAKSLTVAWIAEFAWLSVIEIYGLIPVRGLAAMTALTGGAAIATTMAYISLRSRHRDVDTDLWAGLWRGRIGRAAFAVARKLLGKHARTTAMTHRATELSLGLAAEQLYASLPKQTRHELRNLPALLQRLQRDATALRARHDELHEALADCSETDRDTVYRDAVVVRDQVQANLRDTVGALETIRLSLLRLHAGTGTVESVTTHIELAADVSVEVERMLAARADVDALLKFPRETAATPR